MEYFAGRDILLRNCELCIVDSKGTMLLERELPCEIKDITECLGAFPNPIERVGFEAGTMSQHLFYGLKAEGFDVVCMEARQVNAALSAMRNKTDKNDARGIAQVLRTGWFSPVHMKSIRLDQAPFLTQFRSALMRALASLISFRMRAVRATFGGLPALIMA
jgi:transposase